MADARRWALGAGAVAAALAVSPPMDGAADRSLTAHMVQHLALVTIAAPLLGVGVGAGAGAGAGLGLRLHRRGWLAAGLALSSAALWLWHAPALFDTAVGAPPLHALEHVSLLATSVLLWAAVAAPARRGVGVLALFAATLPATALGAALTLSGHPWYSSYPSLADQRVAGALMWAAASVPGLAGAALLFAWWLSGALRTAST